MLDRIGAREIGPGRVVLDLEGEMDESEDVSRVRLAIAEQMERRNWYIAVNLGRVEYLAGAAPAAFLTGLKRTRERGGAFALCSVAPWVLRRLEITGIHAILSIFETEAAALGYLRDTQACSEWFKPGT